jgi:hypothetical protein
MAKTAQQLLLQYFKDPAAFWKSNTRQAGKSTSRMQAYRRLHGWNTAQCVRIATAVAQERLRARALTLYMPSYGSSGSHLIQHAIGLALPCVELGELYLPPSLPPLLEQLAEQERHLFMEAYGLLHAMNPAMGFSCTIMINTVHNPTLRHFDSLTANYRSVLLLRNPVDLVLSRTFRKDEYRSYLHPTQISDEDYLEQNIVSTEAFYQKALAHQFDGVIRFEDITRAPGQVARTLAGALGMPDIEQPLGERLTSAFEGGASNKYKGPDKSIPPEVRGAVTARLAGLAERVDQMFSQTPA